MAGHHILINSHQRSTEFRGRDKLGRLLAKTCLLHINWSHWRCHWIRRRSSFDELNEPSPKPCLCCARTRSYYLCRVSTKSIICIICTDYPITSRRSPVSARGKSDGHPIQGFADGDFLERFLDFAPSSQEVQRTLDGKSPAEKLKLTPQQIRSMLESLRSFHWKQTPNVCCTIYIAEWHSLKWRN